MPYPVSLLLRSLVIIFIQHIDTTLLATDLLFFLPSNREQSQAKLLLLAFRKYTSVGAISDSLDLLFTFCIFQHLPIVLSDRSGRQSRIMAYQSKNSQLSDAPTKQGALSGYTGHSSQQQVTATFILNLTFHVMRAHNMKRKEHCKVKEVKLMKRDSTKSKKKKTKKSTEKK